MHTLRHMNGANAGMFFFDCQRHGTRCLAKSDDRFGWVHTIDEICDAVNQSYNGYHQYEWVRPRKTWFGSAEKTLI
jgi:hypothetical protein